MRRRRAGPVRSKKVADNSDRKFRLRADQIKPVAVGYGGCFATDMITVDGCGVSFMYRQEPEFKVDSGWRFFAGLESQEYLDNPDNITIYDVNTIANYDPDIIPLLEAPVGSAFERDGTTGEFVEMEFDAED
jgi:hypothetical protein